MKRTGLLAVSVVALSLGACGSKSKQRDAYAVGAYIGGGSVFGPGPKCTYDVTPASSGDMTDTKSSGRLVGPGTVKVKCESGYEEELDIVASDKLEIDGDDKLAVGKDGLLRVSVFGGGRELKTDGHWKAEWTVPSDCDAIVKTKVDEDHGGHSLDGSYTLEMTPLAKGSCTVTASVLGHKSTRTITVQ